MKNIFSTKVINIMICCGMTALLVTAFLPIIGIKWAALRYIFAAGAVLSFIALLFTKSPSNEFRIKRLHHMGVWAGVLYCVSAACLFTRSQDMQNSWVAFLLAGAILHIYSTLMTGKLLDKSKK